MISWPSFVIFSAFVLVIAVFGLAFSGHFPAAKQKPEMRGWPGRLLLWTSAVSAALAGAKMFGLAASVLTFPVAIIAGGAALLTAPLVLQRLPDAFVDGRCGLMTLAAIAGLLMYLAYQVNE